MARSVRKSATPSGAAPLSDQHPIDQVFLARQTLGDPGLKTEVLILFDQMAKVYLGRLCSGPVSDETLMCLHSLKGASAGVGANGLAAQARSAEQEARESGTLSDETLADVAMAVEEVSAHIANLLMDSPFLAQVNQLTA